MIFKRLLTISSLSFGSVAASGASEDGIGVHCLNSCARLSEKFGEFVRYPSDDNYLFWDTKQQEANPACRVQPLTAEDVAFVVRVVVDEGCRFAVKGGGHAREKDDSNSVGGVTIDLQQMQSVEISSDRNKVSLGAGHTLVSAYTALEKEGLTFIGGRAASVGIAGFTLGGGFSNLSPRYGLAMDNVFEYEVVLANATIVTANEHHLPDLYFALRGGGGNNFGIVTRFTTRAVPQSLSWGGSKVYNDDQTDDIVAHVHDLTMSQSADDDFAFWATYTYSGDRDSFQWAVNQAYNPPKEFPDVFKELNAVPSESSTLRLDTPSNFSIEVSDATPGQKRNNFATISHYPSVEMQHALIAIFKQQIKSLGAIDGFSAHIVVQPLHEKSIAAMKLRGGNPVSVEADGPLTVVLLIGTWQDAKDDEAIYTFGEQWLKSANEKATALGVHHPYLYINYALRSQNPYSAFPEESLDRIRRIQNNIDPNGIFASAGLCRGYFKLN